MKTITSFIAFCQAFALNFWNIKHSLNCLENFRFSHNRSYFRIEQFTKRFSFCQQDVALRLRNSGGRESHPANVHLPQNCSICALWTASAHTLRLDEHGGNMRALANLSQAGQNFLPAKPALPPMILADRRLFTLGVGLTMPMGSTFISAPFYRLSPPPLLEAFPASQGH